MVATVAVTDLALADLEQRVQKLGAERFRARQILAWLYRHGARSYEGMTDLPRALQPKLAEALPLRRLQVARTVESSDGTVKMLVELQDGRRVETVVIPDRGRTTACISTQVGCPVACVFCASGLDGLVRNLTAGEIVEQVLLAREAAAEHGRRLTHLVVMGIGEPLLNYEAVAGALRTLHARWGPGIGYHRITLSTVGIAGKIEQLAKDGVTPHLAVSLHAPEDRLRARLVPTVRRWSLEEIVAAAVRYRERTRKDVTFEYVLLAGINDSPTRARELARLLRGSRCKVNLIPYNPVPGLPYERPAPQEVARFAGTLAAAGVRTTIRRPRGDDVAAACGQLRAADDGPA